MSISLFSFQSKDGTIHQGQVPKHKSDGLLVHIHGGGFVAQSSKSHEVCYQAIFKAPVDFTNPVARCLCTGGSVAKTGGSGAKTGGTGGT